MPTTPLNGIEQYYEVHGEGPPLLLLHGFTGCSGDFRHLYDLDELGREHQLLLADLRGHGRSTGLEITHRQCAADMFALLDQLGIGRFKAVGISLGGNTLLHMATEQPARVEAMVLSGSPPYFVAQSRAVMATFTVDTRTPADWADMRARHHHGDEQIRNLWRQGCALKDSYDDMAFTPPRLSQIQARTLLVNGDRDPLYPIELFVDMYRAIPKASLWIVAGGGHAPVFADARPEFVRISRGFLRAAGPAV
jgi:pimeloyl-ACP methyl ester carboxylesterase